MFLLFGPVDYQSVFILLMKEVGDKPLGVILRELGFYPKDTIVIEENLIRKWRVVSSNLKLARSTVRYS